jgi:hypothetical protein
VPAAPQDAAWAATAREAPAREAPAPESAAAEAAAREPPAPGPAAQECSAREAAAQAGPGAPGGLSRGRAGLPLGDHRAPRPAAGGPRVRVQMPAWER